jgi:hypothetical protein
MTTKRIETIETDIGKYLEYLLMRAISGIVRELGLSRPDTGARRRAGTSPDAKLVATALHMTR